MRMFSPIVASACVILLALVCEFVLMLLLQHSDTQYKYLVLIDSTALALMLSPIMYYLMYKPLKRYEQLLKNLNSGDILLGKAPNICTNCCRIQDKNGRWYEVKEFLEAKLHLTCTSSLCQDCPEK